jgi:hypothetical protein
MLPIAMVEGKYPCGKHERIFGTRGGRAFCAIL